MNPKFTKVQLEEVKIQIAEMDRKGYSQLDIGRKLGISQPMVSKHLKSIRSNYKAEQHFQIELGIHYKLAQIREVRAAAWEAFEHSKKPIHKRVREFGSPLKLKFEAEVKQGKKKAKDKGGGPTAQEKFQQDLIKLKEVITREGRLPANEFLNTIIKTLELESKLLGLLEGDTTNNVNQIVLNWAEMAKPKSVEEIYEDDVERKIAAKLSQGSKRIKDESMNGNGHP